MTTNMVKEKNEDDEENEEDTYVLARSLKEKSSSAIFLHTSNVIIRTIKHTNLLYICSEEQWQQKINNYLNDSSIFSYIGEWTSTMSSDATVQEVLMKMSNLVVKTLHQLLYRRAITNEQYNDMMYYNQTIQFEMNKLDFEPQICNNQIVLQPIIKCSSVEPMKGIQNLVNHSLQPLIENKFHSTTFPTANEAIEALIKYTKKYYLEHTALFVTINIHNLHTVLSHDLIIDALKHFFHYYKYDHEIERVSTTTIIELIELLLKNQYCLYDEHQVYQQIRGSSIDSSLITTLMDIYLFSWQDNLIYQLFDFLNRNKSIYVNYPQDMQMIVTVDHKIQYLDAEISHIGGILQTRVYHHPIFQPYASPYASKIKAICPSSSSSSDVLLLLRDALIRAVLYCSNVREYENEQLYIELSFLLNDVSLYLIQKTIENFGIEFHQMKRMRFIADEDAYQFFRSNIRRHYQQQSKYHLREKERQQRRNRPWLY